MKEIVLRMEDSDYRRFMGFIELCPKVQVMGRRNCAEAQAKEQPQGQKVTPEKKGKPEKPDLQTPHSKLVSLLAREAFGLFSTDKEKYGMKWRSDFVKALMGEFGEGVARGWKGNGTRNRQMLIKGHVVGALMAAGVLKGSKAKIARAFTATLGVAQVKEDEAKRFASYLSHPAGSEESRQNPYAEWTCRYILNEE